MALIELNDVCKEFKIFKRNKGFIHSVKSIVHREYEIKKAVDHVSFSIEKGELVGYIGPNGAGKSTTIKMLAGILLPTSGSVLVNGRIPYKNRKENAMRIGLVFGQRSQLYWNLPMEETFDLYRKIYRIDKSRFKQNVEFYTALLQMEDFLRTPVRQLSLGQRMRAELVVSLLHDPDILYLDEPTIGLDVLIKRNIRHFIKEINREKKMTVMLTTHDMDDIEQICSRIITIDKGKIVYDGDIDAFKDRFGNGHTLVVDFQDEHVAIRDARLKVVKEEGARKWILFNKEQISVAEAITWVARNYEITDIQVKEPGIEEAVRGIYGETG
jgi:ABC-2 type transport system ATP-binding protein